MKRLLIVALLLTGCQQSKAPTFNKLPTGAATAPATAAPITLDGGSTIEVTGGTMFSSHADLACSYSVDDFFLRGGLGDLDKIPVYLSVNVEFYTKPGRYERRAQILLRRVSDDGKYYASWYSPTATATVLPDGGGMDVEPSSLPPEAGTHATAPVTFQGHLACSGKPSRGPG